MIIYKRVTTAARLLTFAVAATLMVTACTDAASERSTAPTETTVPEFKDVTAAQWQALASQRIFFGHQSVGGNVIDGVTELLARHAEIPLRVIEGAAFDSSAPPGLYHARVGRNGDPASKTAAFAAVTDASAPAVALVKYCYVDVTGATDPDSLFADYERRMQAIRLRHPDIRLVHATMPLTTIGGRREWLRGLVRRETTSRDLNAIRNRYNTLLLQRYAGREPVFDIARLESTLPDGSRTYFTRRGTRIFHLAPSLSDDGEHLNADGRRAVAEHFLALLATL